jgi:elongator complex protein 3
VRSDSIVPGKTTLEITRYSPLSRLDNPSSDEIFVAFNTPQDHVAAYLRLSLPKHSWNSGTDKVVMKLKDDLVDSAIIREIHVYGQSLGVGKSQSGVAQHSGMGTQLINHAKEMAKRSGYARLAVISAVGTRDYYRSRGFRDGNLYQLMDL